MSEKSAIEWTDSTWNPVTGCSRVSPGCLHCYAERFAERFRGVRGHPYERGFDITLWPDRLNLPLNWPTPRRIFVNSMSDLFHEEVPLSFIRSVFKTMNQAHWHTFQILTKRADRLAQLAPKLNWPRNVWQGVSVERSDFKWRIDKLRRVPAAVRFLSLEPLIGDIGELDLQGISWVIVGGESGTGHLRPMSVSWVRSIRHQCKASRVPFFFKQFGSIENNPHRDDQTAKENGGSAKGGRTLDGRLWSEFPKGPVGIGSKTTTSHGFRADCVPPGNSTFAPLNMGATWGVRVTRSRS